MAFLSERKAIKKPSKKIEPEVSSGSIFDYKKRLRWSRFGVILKMFTLRYILSMDSTR